MKKLHNFIITLSIFLTHFVTTNAAEVDTISVFSDTMDKDVKAIIVLPASDQNTLFPAIYLLHGYSGNYRNWYGAVNLDSLADVFQMILVCPDGSTNSWYLDSPLDKKSQYETFLAEELTAYIDQNYPVFPAKEKKAITGLSMGGHGALYLAARHPNKFTAAASMSGGVDLTYNTNNWEIAQKIGDYKNKKDLWHNNSIVNMIDDLKEARLGLLIDCGVDDFFIGVNRTLHNKLIEAQIPHDYIERPGKHSWDYWVRALPYHLFFFQEQFSQ